MDEINNEDEILRCEHCNYENHEDEFKESDDEE